MNSHGRLSEFCWVTMKIRKDDEIGFGWKISGGGSILMEWGNKIQAELNSGQQGKRGMRYGDKNQSGECGIRQGWRDSGIRRGWATEPR